MKRTMNLLPQVSFSILMALSLKPRHGYEIMQQVKEDSIGKIKLGPGSLYTTVKQLKEDNLIEDAENDDVRRHYYRLTKKGWQRLNAELMYFDKTLKIAKARNVFEALVGVLK
ncbi:MAG: PadR family transcriptional regulator [Candidatus Saccharimonadales bacterium]